VTLIKKDAFHCSPLIILQV